MSGGLGYYCVCRAAHGMVLRLLCMMIDALRCAGVVYLPGMMDLFVHLILGSFRVVTHMWYPGDRQVSRDCMDLYKPSVTVIADL
jgi:hypothetical protein